MKKYTDFDLATKPKTVNNTEDMGLYLLQKLKKKLSVGRVLI